MEWVTIPPRVYGESVRRVGGKKRVLVKVKWGLLPMIQFSNKKWMKKHFCVTLCLSNVPSLTLNNNICAIRCGTKVAVFSKFKIFMSCLKIAWVGQLTRKQETFEPQQLVPVQTQYIKASKQYSWKNIEVKGEKIKCLTNLSNPKVTRKSSGDTPSPPQRPWQQKGKK